MDGFLLPTDFLNLLNRFGLAILVIWSAMTKHVCKVVGKEL